MALEVAQLREALREYGRCKGEVVALRSIRVKEAVVCCRCVELRWWCKNIGGSQRHKQLVEGQEGAT